MIPLKLQLKNFLSYGPEPQTIDFEPYSLICFSGKNGHGKSALLDAITWALWGQARKISGTIKADEALLRVGQTQMMVILDFSYNEQVYRIRREYMKTYGKPYVALDFGILDQEKNGFIPLSSKTIRATQDTIEHTLHLDFNSFVNSAFLRQGQANEFSKKSPKERKEILGTILGLNSYEELRKLAAEKARQANTEKTSLIAYQEKIKQELTATETASDQLESIEQQLKTISQEEQQLVQKRQCIEDKCKQLQEDLHQERILSFKLNQLLEDEIKQQEKLRAIRFEWKKVHAMRLHIPEHHNLEADKNQLLEIINQHQLKLQRSLELKEHYLVYQEQLHAIMQDLQKEQQQILQQESLAVEKLILEKQIHKQQLEQLKQTEHEQKQKQKTIEHELTSCYTQLQKINVNLSKQAPITQQFEKRKEYYQKFIAQGTLVQQELINLQHKQQLAHDDANPSCPLCEQNLSASRRRFLKQKFIKEEQFLKHRYNQFATIVKKLKTLLLEQHKEVEAFTVKANNRQLLLIKQGELGKRNNELQTALQSLQEKQQAEHKTVAHLTESISHASQQLEENEKRSSQFLEENPHYQITKKELHNIEKQLNGINYQPAQHNNMQNQLKEIEKKLVAYQKNLEQITLQDQRKQSIQELCSTLKKMKKEKSVLATKLEAFSSLSSRKEILNEQKQELVSNTHMLGKQKEILLQEKGRLKQQCNKHIQLEHEYKQLQKTVISLVESTEDYQAIAMATSKDGIQALLIQDIIPEIEQEANALLSKLTDNQTQIFIESLRDLKKGGTKETLDIKISDTIGIRPYELFSGGEAFRIDFALRVAISKLLARRAGTSLQTLIIDEGFGSQDEEGLAHIMDAIYKIQDDFAKVIIVSHLSTMKDLFPINFLIEKGINGSTITVLEQG